MQLLQDASKTAASPLVCAQELLDTVPLVMRIIRAYMRGHRSGLTVPQFRTLCYLEAADGSSLSATADYIGLSLPAMSRLVEGLVDKGMLRRRTCTDDRRHMKLSVTPGGEAAIRGARSLAHRQLAEVAARLTRPQRAALVATMQTLRHVFTGDLPGLDEGENPPEAVGKVRRP